MVTPTTEHFVTLFDRTFLPIGLALQKSLMQHANDFILWVLAMDEDTEHALEILSPPCVQVIPLSALEQDRPELLEIKESRTRGEYCWTLGAFSFDAVFSRCPQATRVTYLDSDVFFFADPGLLLAELDSARRQVLITEHGYAPEYDQTAIAGRFCVQFVTFDRSDLATQIRTRWQSQNLESCSSQTTGQKFGDQMYLDEWPTAYPEAVHIADQKDRLLAPWNVRHVCRRYAGEIDPIMYHFHGLRFVTARRVRLFSAYRIGRCGLLLYDQYVNTLADVVQEMEAQKLDVRPMSIRIDRLDVVRRVRWLLEGRERFARVPVKQSTSFR